MPRIFIAAVAAVLAVFGAAISAFAQAYPTRPITVVDTFPPGGNGTTSVIGRFGKVCARAATAAPNATSAAVIVATINLHMPASSSRISARMWPARSSAPRIKGGLLSRNRRDK